MPANLVEQFDDSFPIDEVSAGSGKRVWWKCVEGHRWQAVVSQRSRGFGCPTCFNESRGNKRHAAALTKNPLSQELRSQLVEPGNYAAGSGDRVSWICESGHEWRATIKDRSAGHGCPTCFKTKPSLVEQELADFVSSWGLDIIQSDRTVIAPKELDIYIPSKNMAIEFNGLYWHAEERVGVDYHYNKWLACRAAGIQLITIWEDDWKSNPELVKRMLQEKIMGRKSIGARKTKVVDVDLAQSRKFLEDNHIQGWARGTHYIGLVYEDALVAIMVTKVTRGIARLERFASTMSVVGGMDKMMKHLGYKDWATFADHQVSDGGLYEKTGWINDGELSPDYRYVVAGRREHKFNYRLKKFREDPNLVHQEGLTEKQLATLNGLLRVYDCGKTRYVKTLSF